MSPFLCFFFLPHSTAESTENSRRMVGVQGGGAGELCSRWASKLHAALWYTKVSHRILIHLHTPLPHCVLDTVVRAYCIFKITSGNLATGTGFIFSCWRDLSALPTRLTLVHWLIDGRANLFHLVVYLHVRPIIFLEIVFFCWGEGLLIEPAGGLCVCTWESVYACEDHTSAYR